MSEEDLELIWTTVYVGLVAALCNIMTNKLIAMQTMFIALGCWFVIIAYSRDRMCIYIEKCDAEKHEEKITEEEKINNSTNLNEN